MDDKYKVTINDIGGKVIRNTDIYQVIDNSYLQNLILSKTILNPNKCTNGHKHDGLDEIYFFNSGSGIIELDDIKHHVTDGDVILIKGGVFHKVYNTSSESKLEFTCVFQTYNR